MYKPCIRNHFIFHDNITRIFNLIKDHKRSDSIFEDIRSPTQITLGHNTFEVGNEFFYTVGGKRINFKVISYLDDDNKKGIKWNINTDVLNYDYEYVLTRCTVEKEVLLEWTIIFNHKIPHLYDSFVQDQFEIMNRFDKRLQTDLSDCYHSESTIIKSDRNSILNLITDFKKVSENCDFCFGKVQCRGKALDLDTHLIMRFPIFNSEVKYVVNKIDINDQSNTWIYSLKNLNSYGIFANIKQLVFILVKINDKKTLLEVRQYFNHFCSNEKLRGLSEMKIKIFSFIHRELEHSKK